MTANKLVSEGWEMEIPKSPKDRYGVFSPHQVLLISCKDVKDAEKYAYWYEKKHNPTIKKWDKKAGRYKQIESDMPKLVCSIRLMRGQRINNVQLPKQIHEQWDIIHDPYDENIELYLPYEKQKWTELSLPEYTNCDMELITSPFASPR